MLIIIQLKRSYIREPHARDAYDIQKISFSWGFTPNPESISFVCPKEIDERKCTTKEAHSPLQAVLSQCTCPEWAAPFVDVCPHCKLL